MRAGFRSGGGSFGRIQRSFGLGAHDDYEEEEEEVEEEQEVVVPTLKKKGSLLDRLGPKASVGGTKVRRQ